MIFNEDNFYEAMSEYEWDEDLDSRYLLIQMEDLNPTHFFIYENYDEDILDTVDIVFCNFKDCYNIYLITDINEVVIDYDFTYGVNIKILEEKL